MPSKDAAIGKAASLLAGFSERTGLTSERPPTRYLWTDAFAVCTLLGLARATGEARFTQLALRLVHQVHHVLGRFRPDDSRTGWLSGLGEQEGEAHPTRGGLRIGKKLPERGPGEPYEAEFEWDRDGQYFHYLTRWMHALDRVSCATDDPRFHLWARELAEVAHARFTSRQGGSGGRRMVWKMSTDLSRPLVPSMGQHDPLDGYVTCLELESTAALRPEAAGRPDLGPAVTDFAWMVETLELGTSDPLGLGTLLSNAWGVAQLMARGRLLGGDLVERLLVAAGEGLARYSGERHLRQPASWRLAFRELGLAIGLSALEALQREAADDRRNVFSSAGLRGSLQRLAPHLALGPALVSFWLEPEHQQARTWTEHRDINEVMLAAALVPGGFLAT